MPVPVNGERIDRIAVFVRSITVSLMMPVMENLVELLRKPDGHGKNPAEDPVKSAGFEVGIVNEVVGDAVDIPRDADGVDKAEDQENPPWCVREDNKEHCQIGRMPQLADHRNPIF